MLVLSHIILSHKLNPHLLSLRVRQDPKDIKTGFLLTTALDIFEGSLKLSFSYRIPRGALNELM